MSNLSHLCADAWEASGVTFEDVTIADVANLAALVEVALVRYRDAPDDEAPMRSLHVTKVYVRLDRETGALAENVGSGPAARSEATIFLCGMCVHAMITVYAEASSPAFKYEVNGSPFPPLDEILARSATPPPTTMAR